MSTRHIATRDRRKYLKQTLGRVARDRQHAPGAADIARLQAGMSDDDAVIRAKTLREICPCHMNWDVFLELRKGVKLLQSDPDARVKEVAYHIEEDALHIEALEALNDSLSEFDDHEEEYNLGKSREFSQRERRNLRRGL